MDSTALKGAEQLQHKTESSQGGRQVTGGSLPPHDVPTNHAGLRLPGAGCRAGAGVLEGRLWWGACLCQGQQDCLSPRSGVCGLALHTSYFPVSVPGMQNMLFSHLVASDFLQPHGLQHARPPCPSPTPAICSNPRLLYLPALTGGFLTTSTT